MASRDVQRAQLHHFLSADKEYGTRVADALGLNLSDAINANG